MKIKTESELRFIAGQLLTGDRLKYFGLVQAIAFSTFRMPQQMSIFAGLLDRTRSQIRDVQDASVWVTDPKTQYVDEVRALSLQDLYFVRGVEGLQWAVPLLRGGSRAKSSDGTFRNSILMGVEDASPTGLPRQFLAGGWQALRNPKTVAIDRVGYRHFLGNGPCQAGQELELGPQGVRAGAVVDASPPFVNLPVVYASSSESLDMIGRERRQMSFILAKARPGVIEQEVCRRIEAAAGLKALASQAFGWTRSGITSKTPAFPSTSASPSSLRSWQARWSPGRYSRSLSSKT